MLKRIQAMCTFIQLAHRINMYVYALLLYDFILVTLAAALIQQRLNNSDWDYMHYYIFARYLHILGSRYEQVHKVWESVP